VNVGIGFCSTLTRIRLEFVNMTTTSIRLPAELKARVAKAAAQSGTTSHGFILEAIAEKTEAAEKRRDFYDIADQRFAGIVASGKTIAWQDMRKYMVARAESKPAKRPKARKIAR
jgi:predicted DNA-binding protein